MSAGGVARHPLSGELMHELGIAASVLDVVRIELGTRPGHRATAVGLRIGTLAGLDPESLRFGFEAMVKNSDLDPLRLDIEEAAADELDIAWIEMEEP